MIKALLVSLLATIALAACGGDDDDGSTTDNPVMRATMRGMVLQETDMPDGLHVFSGDFSTNADAASFLGAGPTEEQLDEWGRILGFQITYQRADPLNADVVSGVTSSISLYEEDTGAGDSFSERVTQARAADWSASHADLAEFEQLEVTADLPADDQLWLRFTGFKEVAPGETVTVSDNQIVFRVGRSWGYLNVISTSASGGIDRAINQAITEDLARTQIDNMKAALNSGALG